MSFRSRRGATGLDLLSAMMLANLVGAWTYDSTSGWATLPSSYATEGGSKPPTGSIIILDNDGETEVTFDTTNTVPGKGNTCPGSKTGCTTGGITTADLDSNVAACLQTAQCFAVDSGGEFAVDSGGEHLVLSRDGTLHPAGESDLQLGVVAAADADHFQGGCNGSGDWKACEVEAHIGGADVHCMALTTDEATELLDETGLASCGGFRLQIGGGLDNTDFFTGTGRIERTGNSLKGDVLGGESDIIACVTYGDTDGEVLAVTVLTARESASAQSTGFMDYTDDACMDR